MTDLRPLALIIGGLVLALPPAAAIAEPMPSPIASADAPLRRLPLTGSGWTLSGETARLQMPLYLDPNVSTRSAELVLAFESAVSVMPEASTLVASINGQTIGRVGLGADNGGKPAAIAIPPSVLRAGWNTVTLAASQRHRVDCSVDGTYELWTRLDPTRSGLRLASASASTGDLKAIAGLSPGDDGLMPIRMRLEPTDDASFTAGLRLAAMAARLTGTLAPTVEYDRAPGSGAGLDIAFGRSDALAALGFSADDIAAAASEPRLVAAANGQRPTLLVATDRGGADRAFARLEEAAAATGPAPRDGASIDHAATTLSLAALGRTSEQFSGHLWHQSMHVRLPSDSLIADYGSVTLHLSAGYAPGLDSEDNLSLFVSGKLAATIPFGNGSGAMIDNRRIELPLSTFRPGDNEIEFVARTTTTGDAACAPHDQISGNARFLILNSTSISLPKTARAMRLPDLGATLANGRTAAADGSAVRLAITERTPANLGAAATLYAKMAVLSADLPDLEADLTPSSGRSAGRLLIGTRNQLPAALRQLVQIDAGASLPAADRNAASLLSPDAVITGSTAASPATTSQQTVTDPLVEEWRNRVGTPKNRWTDVFGMVGNVLGQFAETLGLSHAEAPSLPASASFIVAQGLGEDNEPVTLVTAADPATLKAGVADLVQPANWRQLGGATLYLDGLTGKWQSREASHQAIVSTGPADFDNLRMTTAAWFAMNTPVYAGLLALAGILFGLTAYATVRSHGARSDS